MWGLALARWVWPVAGRANDGSRMGGGRAKRGWVFPESDALVRVFYTCHAMCTKHRTAILSHPVCAQREGKTGSVPGVSVRLHLIAHPSRVPRNKVPPPAAAAATASFQRNAQILPCVGRPFRSLRLHLLALKGKHAYRTASDCLRCGTSQWKLPCSNYVGMGHRTSSAEFEELLAANTTHGGNSTCPRRLPRRPLRCWSSGTYAKVVWKKGVGPLR